MYVCLRRKENNITQTLCAHKMVNFPSSDTFLSLTVVNIYTRNVKLIHCHCYPEIKHTTCSLWLYRISISKMDIYTVRGREAF